MDFLRQHEPQTHALLRIVAGFLFLWHGMQKLFGFPGEMPAGVPAFITWIAGPIEKIGPMNGVFALRAYQPFPCRIYPPAAAP